MKILLFTPNFFDYPKQICDELRYMGHEIDWFDDRPSTNSFIKAIVRIKKDIIAVIIKKYFNDIMKKIGQKKYDKVIIISGQSLSFTEEMLLLLKQVQEQAEFVLYQWDSEKNFKYITTLQKYFDRCYSFDREDVKNHRVLQFLPLFFGEKYELIGRKTSNSYKYDLMFVGTAHPRKYKYVREMAEKLQPIYKNQFIYFFYPSKLVYFYRKIRNPELKRAKYSEFHFEPVNGKKMDELLFNSRCILDSAQDGQIGLTIRVLESLGAKRKIITTNSDVINYNFYREENIYVYSGEFNLNAPFFSQEYCELPENIYKEYSLRSWLNILLGEEKIYEYDKVFLDN